MNHSVRRNAAVVVAAWTLVALALFAAAPVLAASRTLATSGSLVPVVFEANRGQVDPGVKFLARGAEHALFITKAEAVLVHRRNRQAVRLRFLGGRSDVEVTGLEPLSGRIHYIRGRDPAAWRTDVPTYARVAYRGAYPGIDAIYRTTTESRFEQEFLIRPGADPALIHLEFADARTVAVDESGDLVIATEGAPVRMDRPIAYQELDGVRRRVSVAWTIKGPKEAGFQLGPYDRSRALVIDPVITWATYLGGGDTDQAFAIAVDSAGNSYVTGDTNSYFPTTDGSQPTLGAVITIPCPSGGGSSDAVTWNDDGTGCPYTFQLPSIDVFVTKLNPTGRALVYSVLIGGTGDEGGRGIALDPNGNAYVAGFTNSPDFPTTAGAFQSRPGGGLDAFVLKLDPAGVLVYATYLGGRGDDVALGIAVDAAGRAHVAGGSRSPDFPVANAFQPLLGGTNTYGMCGQDALFPCIRNAFVTRLSPEGSVEYSTFLGGESDAVANAIALDELGNAYLTGGTGSSFPVTPGTLQSHFGGDGDAFVAKIDADATLGWATYLGGSALDVGTGIAVDSGRHSHVVGITASTDFPVTGGAQFTGATEGFVLRLASDGNAIDWSRSTGSAIPAGVALGGQGQSHFVGTVRVDKCTGTPGALSCSSQTDVAVETRAATGEKLSSLSFGGGADNFGQAIAASRGSLWVAGTTGSFDFPVTPGSFQSLDKENSMTDGFVVRLDDAASVDGGSSLDGDGSSGKCLIATAAFGSPFAWEVTTFRRFRDRALLPHAPGRLLVRAYYRLSPPLAHAVERQPVLAAAVRAMLGPVAVGADFAMNRPAFAIGLAGAGLAVVLGLGVLRRKPARRIRAAAVICMLLGGMLLVVVVARSPQQASPPSPVTTPPVGPGAKVQPAPWSLERLQTEAAPDFRALLGGGASITPLNPFAERAERRFAVTSELIEGVLSAKGFVVTDPRRTRAIGIEAGDTIARINGYPPTGLIAVIIALQRDPDRAAVVLEIDRGGTRLVRSHRVR
jgi:Beta-propeller repeat